MNNFGCLFLSLLVCLINTRIESSEKVIVFLDPLRLLTYLSTHFGKKFSFSVTIQVLFFRQGWRWGGGANLERLIARLQECYRHVSPGLFILSHKNDFWG